MASPSGPEEFIVNLLILLSLTTAGVLLGDRLLRSKSWRRLGRAEGRKRRGGPVPTKVVGDEDEVASARLTRNYFNNGRGGAQTQVERDFGTLYGEVNDALNDDPRGARASTLFKRIDEQYVRMLSFFVDKEDRGSSLHMEHNYLWLKYRQRSDDDPNGAFMVLVQSLGKLMERQGVQPYTVKEFAQMIERYEGTMGHLHQTRGLNVNNAMVGFFSFSARLNLVLKEHPDPVAQEAVGKVIAEFVRIMLERHYVRMVQSHFLTELKVEHIQSITDQVEGLRRVQEGTGRPDPQVHMVCHYLVCRLRMAQLRAMATLEPSPGRALDMHEAHMRKLANDAAASGGEAIRWASQLAEQNRRGMLAQTEIVSLLAAHFQATYAKRHVLESWNTMEAVKRKIVEEVVGNRVPVAEELLASCDEEWRVLNSSTKEWFSRQARRGAPRQEGPSPPGGSDGGLWGLRYLSQMQDQGVPPETVVRVLEAVKKASPGRRSWPPGHKEIMKALAGRGEVRRLELAGPSYAGVMVGTSLGLLIKATDERVDAGSITVAVEACQKAGAREVVVCVNFSAELVTAETLRRFFAIVERRGSGLKLSAVDTEYLISALIACLRESGHLETFEIAPNLAV